MSEFIYCLNVLIYFFIKKNTKEKKKLKKDIYNDEKTKEKDFYIC